MRRGLEAGPVRILHADMPHLTAREQTLAHLLEARQEELLARWAQEVQRHLTPGPLSRVELMDHMPQFVRELLDELRRHEGSAPGGPSTPNPVALAREHGRERYRLGFSLGAVVREYGVLRDLLLDLLAEQGAALPITEWKVVARRLTEAIAEAVAQYERERERQVRGSEQRLQAIIDNAPAIVFIKDAEGRYVLVNRGFEKLTGVSRHEVLGRMDDDVFPPEVAATFRANDAQVRETHAPLMVEEPAPHPDGMHSYFTLKFPLEDPHGGPPQVCGISTDITEHTRIRKALREVQARLRTVLSHVPVILWAIDAHGMVTVAEGKGLTLAGRKPEAMVGHSIFELYRDVPWVLANMRRALAGEEFCMEHELTAGQRWMEHHYIPQRDAEGRVVAVAGLSVDITERKQAQLFQQRLLGIVGHDIRSPLSAIKLGAERLLQHEQLPPTAVTTVRRIRSSAERITGLVATLLDFTRAQLGQGLPVVPRSICLHEVGGRVVDEVQASHPERTLLCDAAGDTCGQWDPDRLEQLVSNLVENALKYGAPGTPVTVRYRGEHDAVTLAVHNQGPPIPPQLRPHLFEPFRKGEHAEDKARSSLGLGLYIVRQIVEAHGGTVDVQSNGEQGTTFTVRLPRHPPPPAPPGA
jgi:PAS domain S-box-containing protein